VEHIANSIASTPTPATKPGLTTADIVGIVIGVVGGVAVLLGVMYVYFLRLRVLGRTYVRSKSGKKSIGSSGMSLSLWDLKRKQELVFCVCIN
jgi:hypothetical protein